MKSIVLTAFASLLLGFAFVTNVMAEEPITASQFEVVMITPQAVVDTGDMVGSRDVELQPLLPWHGETTDQPAYYDMITSTLYAGWNWWSPQMRATLSQLQSAIGESLVQIKTEGGGDLGGNVVAGEMYRIQTNAGGSLSMREKPFTEATVTINEGENWFGYIGEEKAIAEALGSFTPAEGDKIISQDNGFAVYNGTSWNGTLTSLVPGQGYVYVSNDRQTKTFVIE